MLRAENLTKQYGNILSADSLDFTIKKGEVAGLLGANGAGKSTTMNMLTGCLAPTRGTVTVFGYSMQEEPLMAKRQIGYLPEIPPLYTDMTVTEQLLFAARLRWVEKTRHNEEIDRVCEQTNITGMRKRMIKQLSKGYRQRVGMAQALIGSPELLIFDEPTAGLDPKQIIDIRNLIIQLKEKHTIILSSHILSEISSVCTRLLILKEGKLVADNTPEELSSIRGDNILMELKVKGAAEQIRAVLGDIPGISDLQVKESPEQGYAWVLLNLPQKSGAEEALFFALAKAACPAVMIKPAKPTLEEMFIKLTT